VAAEDDALTQAPLFEALSEDDARALRLDVINVQLGRGERLFSEGDAGDKLFNHPQGQDQTDPGRPRRAENLLSVHGPARCSVSCPCSTRARRTAQRHRHHGRDPGRAGP